MGSAPSKEIQTQWIYACINKKEQLAKELIDKGYYEMEVFDGQKPLFFCTQSPEITKLLIDKKVDVNYQNKNNSTALHQAAYYNSLDSIKLLISAGAKLDKEDNSGNTPFDVSRDFGNKQAKKLLREEMIKRNIFPEKLNSHEYVCKNEYELLEYAKSKKLSELELEPIRDSITKCVSEIFEK